MVIWDDLSRNPDLRSPHLGRTFQTEQEVQRPLWACPCSPTPNTPYTGEGRREAPARIHRREGAPAPIHRREGAPALHSGKRNGSSADDLWEDPGVWGPWRSSLQRLGSYRTEGRDSTMKNRVRKYPPRSQWPTVLLQFGVWSYMIQNLRMFLVSSPSFSYFLFMQVFIFRMNLILLFVKKLKSNWHLKWTNSQPQTLSVTKSSRLGQLLKLHLWFSDFSEWGQRKKAADAADCFVRRNSEV